MCGLFGLRTMCPGLWGDTGPHNRGPHNRVRKGQTIFCLTGEVINPDNLLINVRVGQGHTFTCVQLSLALQTRTISYLFDVKDHTYYWNNFNFDIRIIIYQKKMNSFQNKVFILYLKKMIIHFSSFASTKCADIFWLTRVVRCVSNVPVMFMK